MSERDVKAAAWDELRNMTWDDWRAYTERWEPDHPLVERCRIMDLLLAKHSEGETTDEPIASKIMKVDQLDEWSSHIWHVSQHGRIVIDLAGRLQRIANEIREQAGLEPFGWNDSIRDERFDECSVHNDGCKGQHTHPEVSKGEK